MPPLLPHLQQAPFAQFVQVSGGSLRGYASRACKLARRTAAAIKQVDKHGNANGVGEQASYFGYRIFAEHILIVRNFPAKTFPFRVKCRLGMAKTLRANVKHRNLVYP
jgi:hypothetical protein